MLYFSVKIFKKISRFGIAFRKARPKVNGFKNAFFVYSGDVLEVFFSKRGSIFTFEGICLAIKKKNFLNVNASIVLRNFIHKVGIQCIFSYYYNRIYFFKINDYKRKFDSQRKAKLYFLSRSLNYKTRV
jgi:ribosomal protein L19